MPSQFAEISKPKGSTQPGVNRVGFGMMFVAVALLLLTSLSCAILPAGVETEATAVAVSSGEILTFQLPISVMTLAPGETIPYTQLTYEGHVGNLYRVLIDNQAAEKRAGDSFRWRGVIAPGITAHYNLRIAPTFSPDNMLVGGSIEFGVFNPVPVEMESDPVLADELLHFSNMFVDYTVPIGEIIPGTTISFLGQNEEDAELSGVAGYPYRAVGDSVTWQGRLRDNTSVSYSLRIVSIKEDSLRLIGTSEMWINPAY
ncbi:MAG TPA: hypothetical protein VFI27_15620 [candidate division Zixibacteria bacterium]|nr:hypothetical protein [candidate division Zixibacteria bacterium]